MTDFQVKEPRGWERQKWGQPSSGDDQEDMEYRTEGWGDPKTKYTEDNST